MVEFEPNRAYGFLGNRISDDILGTEGRKEGQTDREMVNYSMILKQCFSLCMVYDRITDHANPIKLEIQIVYPLGKERVNNIQTMNPLLVCS